MKRKKIKIIYEDKFILVVDKDTNLLTVATAKEKEKTLYHEVHEYLKKKNQKVFIVHRLDKDTSGLIIFAKNEKIKAILQNNWNDLVFNREYMVIVDGNVENKQSTIKSYLRENSELYTYSTNDKSDGKLAITKYRKIMGNKKMSLLRINLLTGRKNQIRVHMQDIGHPIIGDKKYGNNRIKVERLMLHASKLEIIHPITKDKRVFESKIPSKMQKLIDIMEGDNNVRN